MIPLSAVVLMLAGTPARAADEQLWSILQVQGPIGHRLIYSVDAQTRVVDGVSRISLYQLQGLVGIHVGAGTVAQGYAHTDTPQVNARARNEERSFQQLAWPLGRIGRGHLSGRLRVEERWRSDGDDMQVRFRQQVRYRLPIGRSRFGAIVSGEAFEALNAVDWNPRSGAEQGRLYAGLDAPLARHVVGELGYLHQISDARHRATTAANILLMTLSLRH